MSKESRQRARENAQRATTRSGASRPPTSQAGQTDQLAPGEPGATSAPAAAAASARPSTSPSGSARAGRRERARSGHKPSIVERYRSLLVGAAIVAVVAIVGVGLFSAATTPTYACSNEWVPDPTSTPGANASPQPGYPQPDMGNQHVSVGTTVTFTYCPPASGRHYNTTGAGPLAARLYGPSDTAGPTGWVHNLEHGGIVILYRGDGEGATEAGQAALRTLFDDYPPSPVCGLQPGTNGPVIARFDEMATPFAALVWGRVLPLDTLDTAAILEFDATYGERTNPEQFCQPTPAPTASPSASASASVAPSASANAAPSASDAPSPSTAPSTSPSPS